MRFDPYAAEMDRDPFPTYRDLRAEHPCFWSEDARMWVLSRYEDIITALNDWRTYSSASGNLMDELPGRAGATLGTSDPPRHDRLRGLIQHAFAKRNVTQLEGHIAEAARSTLDEVRGLETFDFVDDVSAKVTVKVLFRLLGLPSDDDDVVRDKAVLMVQTDPVSRRKGPEHIAAYEWVQAYAAGIIADRRRAPQDDLISGFAQAEIDGERLSEREVLLTTTTLIMAGIESLGGFMTMFAYNLAELDEVRRACVAAPELIPDAIEESLRFNTSAQRFRRRLGHDVDLHGQTLRAGEFVCLAYGSGNRDDRQFPDGEIYRLDRKPRGHLGFGGGVHACLGSSIARLATRVVFEAFLTQVPEFKRLDGDLSWMPSTTFRSPTGLRLAVR